LKLRAATNKAEAKEHAILNDLNAAILDRMQKDGLVYLSNAVIGGRYALRACVVNFRTTSADIRAVVDCAVTTGRALAR
jgi:hypothetical protein